MHKHMSEYYILTLRDIFILQKLLWLRYYDITIFGEDL